MNPKYQKHKLLENLRINENTLYTWIDKYSKSSNAEGIKTDKHIYDELKSLKQELVRVTQ
jgi:hypothetical protein